MFVDPVAVVRECLQADGWTNVHPDGTDLTERISSEALSGNDYIWIEEQTGDTPHALYADRPAIQIVLYSDTDPWDKARKIQHALALASRNVTNYPSGGIHRSITVIRPYRQDISGLPPGVVRVSALYELIISTQEKWD